MSTPLDITGYTPQELDALFDAVEGRWDPRHEQFLSVIRVQIHGARCWCRRRRIVLDAVREAFRDYAVTDSDEDGAGDIDARAALSFLRRLDDAFAPPPETAAERDARLLQEAIASGLQPALPF